MIEPLSLDGMVGILRKTKAGFKTKAKTHDHQTLVKRRRMVKRKMNCYSISTQLHFGGTSLSFFFDILVLTVDVI